MANNILKTLESIPGNKIVTYSAQHLKLILRGNWYTPLNTVYNPNKVDMDSSEIMHQSPRLVLERLESICMDGWQGYILVRQFGDVDQNTGYPWKYIHGFKIVDGEMKRMGAKETKEIQCSLNGMYVNEPSVRYDIMTSGTINSRF